MRCSCEVDGRDARKSSVRGQHTSTTATSTDTAVCDGGIDRFGGPGMMFGKVRKYTFTAKPGVYEEGAIKAASLANTRLAEQLAALR